MAFRVIADHIRTLSFAIADGIQPGNTDRNYVLRRILRRAVRYGRTLGFHEPFFYKLVDVLAETMGDVFPEIREKQKHVRGSNPERRRRRLIRRWIRASNCSIEENGLPGAKATATSYRGAVCVQASMTPMVSLDLTELMARERGLTVDMMVSKS